MVKLKEFLAVFATLASEKWKNDFCQSLALHYQNLSPPCTGDSNAPNYRAIFEEVAKIVKTGAPKFSEIATFHFAAEQTAPRMNNETRDLCEKFVSAALRYCYKIPWIRYRIFSDDFQEAFNDAIIRHYTNFGISAFIEDRKHLSSFSQTVSQNLERLDRQNQKETPDPFDSDVPAPDAPPELFASLNETLAFLESLRPRKFDPILVALFGSARDGFSYLNPSGNSALRRELERERYELRKLLDKRFPVGDK